MKSVSTSTIHSGSKTATCLQPSLSWLYVLSPSGLASLDRDGGCWKLPRSPDIRVWGGLWAASQLLFLGLLSFSTAPWLLLLTYLMRIQGTLCSPSAQLPGHVQQGVACAFGTTLKTSPSLTNMLEFLL